MQQHSTILTMPFLKFCWRSCIAGVLLLISASAAWAVPPVAAGPYRVAVVAEPAVLPTTGQAKLRLNITDAGGKPVAGAQVKALTKMPGMNMGEREQPGLVLAGQPGVYIVPATFAMEGSYQSTVQISGPLGNATAIISLHTGEDTAGAATSNFSLWTLLPWLVSLLIAGFVFYRIRRTGQRIQWRAIFNRQALGGLGLLAGMLAVSIYAVQRFRRPDAITPIQAQAMDMNLPAPPGLVPVRLAKVESGTVASTVRYSGQAVGYIEQEVYPRVAGNITWMPFYAGDRVRRGQLLARLDTSQAAPQVTEREAALRQAQQMAGIARSGYQQALGGVSQAHAEIGTKLGALTETRSSEQKAHAEVTGKLGALSEARSGIRKAQAEVTGKLGALTEARSGETRTRAALREAQSSINEAQGARDAVQSDLIAAQEERTGAEAAVAAAQPQVTDAQAQLQAAQADQQYWVEEIARERHLMDEGAVSKEEFQREQAQADNAAAKVRSAQARINQVQAGVKTAQAQERKAAAMITGAGAKARQAQAGLESGQAKREQAQADIGAAGARTQQAAAAVRSAQADVGGATARVQEMAADARAAQSDVGGAIARESQAQADLEAHHAHVRQMEAAASGAQRQIGQSEAGIEQARAALTAVTTTLGYTEVRSLVDGVVTQRLISPGTLVNPGQAILKVAQTSPMRLQANVAEADLKQVRVGARVTIRSQSDAHQAVVAQVTSVAPSVDPTSRTGLVEAVVPNRNNLFLPGQYVAMEIQTGQSLVTPRVPTVAIQYRAGGEATATQSTPYVWVAEPAGAGGQYTAHPIDVRLGASDGRTTAVLAGLKNGQQVVIAGYQYLKDGDTVAPEDSQPDSERLADNALTPTAMRGMSKMPSNALAAATATPAITVNVTEKGFAPDHLTLRTGVLAHITFTRQTDQTCATSVVFPDYNIKQDLPLHKPVVIQFTPRKTGAFTFSCGMNMLHGQVVAQ